jgi:hypothetical protein
MRSLLRLLGTRYGFSLVLVVLVFGVVAAFRGIVGQPQDTGSAPVLAQSPRATGEPVPDDGLALPSDLATPTLAPSAATAVTARATGFATAWLRHTGVGASEWHKGLAPHASASLLARLKNVDPVTVPAERVVGEIQLKVTNLALVEARVPVDAGTLELDLVLINGQWRVDAVGWEPAR